MTDQFARWMVNLLVIAGYLAGLLWLGVYLARYIRSEADYFLAGRCLNRWVLAGTVMATNVAAVFLIGPAAAAAKHGPAVMMIAWSGNMIAALAALAFVPRWRALRITTITEFLERRFGTAVSLFVIVLWIAYYTLFAGLNLYALAAALSPVISIDLKGLILVAGGVVAIFCFSSGMVGVVYTDVIQAFLIILGGVILLPLSLKAVGGIAGLQAATQPGWWRFWKPIDQPVNTLDVLMYVMLGLPYWCTSQYMLQRCFAGKNLREASRGLLLAALLTGPLTLTFILPGIAGGILYQRMGLEITDRLLPELFYRLLPVGLGGLFLAALMAASNSTASSLLNSAATLFDRDIYRRFRPMASDGETVWIGRVITAVLGVAAVAFGLMCAAGRQDLLTAVYQVMGLFEPPVFVVVAGGLLWSEASKAGAILALLSGFGFGLGVTLDLYGPGGHLATAYRTLWEFPISAGALIIGSALWPSRKVGVAVPLARPAGPYPLLPRFGLTMATFSMLALLLAAFHESRWISLVPTGTSILIYLGLTMLFILGLYMAVPMFVPLAREPVQIAIAGDVETSLLHRVFGSGLTWALLYAGAITLAIVLYRF